MTQSKDLREIRVKEAIFILEKCRSEFAMDKRLALINSREIALNKLKLNLMGNSKFLKKFFFILKILFKFPSLIFYRFRK